jgi:hypothetical protein
MSRARFIQYLLSSRSRLDIVVRRVEWRVRRPGAVDLAFLHDQHAVADGGAQPLIETCDKEVVTKVAEDQGCSARISQMRWPAADVLR